jgi:hypothetical protein
MSIEVSFYDQTTGLFHSHWLGPENQMAGNTPPNCKHVVGRHELYGSRVDISTGEVVAHVPPPPTPDHVWDPNAKRHVLSDNALHMRATLTRIASLEVSQQRPQRELILDPTNAEARKRLSAIDSEISALRGALGNQ